MKWCINCGKTSHEKQMFSIDSLCPELYACANCISKYPGVSLQKESHRQLIYNKHGLFPSQAVACEVCGERACLYHADGKKSVWCQKCSLKMQAAINSSGLF